MPKDLPKMPNGLEDLLRGLSKAVLKEKPENILVFSANYFENLLIERDGSLMKNYERFDRYEKSINKAVKEKKIKSDSEKKNVKSEGKKQKPLPKVVKSRGRNTKPNDHVEREAMRKTMEAVSPRGKLKSRTRSSMSLNAISEETSSEMKAERQLRYRNAVKKIQRAFRKYLENKKHKNLPSTSDEGSKPQKMDENRAARIIQNLFKSKYPKKTSPEKRPRSIKNKNLKRVAEGGEDSKSLLEYLQEEENAKKTQPNIELDSDTGETLTTRVDEVNISNADSLENMIINDDMNREQDFKVLNQNDEVSDKNNKDEEKAATKIQSTFRGYQARKEIKQRRTDQRPTTSTPAHMIEDTTAYKSEGEMELAAVKIQKIYRGYKVRKDLLNTKNVVNSGNLVATAGNIIGSIVSGLNPNDWLSGSKLAENTRLHSGEDNGIINSKETSSGTESFVSINESKANNTETPEILNTENISKQILNDADLGNENLDDKSTEINETKLTSTDGLLGSSPVSEVSQNTTQHIEPNIGINEQEHKNQNNLTSKDVISETLPTVISSAIAEGNKIAEDIVGSDKTGTIHVIKSNFEDGETTNIGLIEPNLESELNATKKNITGEVHEKNDSIDIEPIISINGTKQERESTTTKVVKVEDSPVHDVVNDSEIGAELHHFVNDSVIRNEELPRTANIDIESESTKEMTESKNHPFIESLIDSPVDISRTTESKNEIESMVLNHLQEEITNQAPVETLTTGQPTLKTESNNEHITHTSTTEDETSNQILHSTDQNLLHNQDSLPDLSAPEMADAALKIQKTFRGHQARKQNQSPQKHIIPEVTIDGASEEMISDSEDVEVPQQQKQNKIIDLNGSEMNNAAVKIQKSFRGYQVRKDLEQKKVQLVKMVDAPVESTIPTNNQFSDDIAKSLQTETVVDGISESNGEIKDDETDQSTPIPDQHMAAIKIQKTYRGHHVRQELKQKKAEMVKSAANVRNDITSLPIGLHGMIQNHNEHPIDLIRQNPTRNETDFQNQENHPGLNDRETDEASLNVQDGTILIPDELDQGTLVDNQTDLLPSYSDAIKNLNKENENELIDKPTTNENNGEINISTPVDSNKPEITSMKSEILSETSESEVIDPVKVDAAVKIQKSYRGHKARKDYKQKKEGLQPKTESDLSSAVLEESANEKHSINLIQSTESLPQHESTSIDQSADNLPTNNKAPEHQGSLPDLNDQDMADAALKIQKSFRGHQARKNETNVRNKRSIDFNEEQPLNDSSLIGTIPAAVDNIEHHHMENDKQKKASPQSSDLSEFQEAPMPIMDLASKADENKSDDIPIKNQDNLSDLNDPEIVAIEHQDSLPDLNDPEMTDAALKIQKSFRGHRERKESKQQNNEQPKSSVKPTTDDSTIVHDSVSPIPVVIEHQDSLPDLDDPEMADAALKIQKSFRGHRERKESKQQNNEQPKSSVEPTTDDSTIVHDSVSPILVIIEHQDSLPDLDDPEMADAALKIQKSFRGHRERKESKQRNIEQPKSAIEPTTDDFTIVHDSVSPIPIVIEHQESLPDLNDPEMADAALKIQKSFRGHRERKESKQQNNEQPKSSVEPETDDPTIVHDSVSPIPVTIEHTVSLSDLNDPEMADAARERKESKQQNNGQPKVSVEAAVSDLTIVYDSVSPNIVAIEHQDSLPDLNDPEMADAALKIQKSFRGHQARKEQLKPGIQSVTNDSPVDNELTSKPDSSKLKNQDKDLCDTSIAPAAGSTRDEHQDNLPDLNEPEMVDAALKIQKSFRGHKSRKEIKQNKSDKSGEMIQPAPNASIVEDPPEPVTKDELVTKQENLSNYQDNGKLDSSALEHKNSLPDLTDPEMTDAALKIQKSFRGHQTRKELKLEHDQIKLADKLIGDVTSDAIATAQIDNETDSKQNVDSIDEVKLTSPVLANQDSLPDLTDPEMADAALKIQKSFRGHKARKEFKDTKESIAIDKILSKATAPTLDAISDENESFQQADPAEETTSKTVPTIESNILSNIAPGTIAIAAETAAINIQRTYRGYRTRRDLKSQNFINTLAPDAFEDENKLVDSLEPILDQKSEDKIDADSLDNFNVEEKTEVFEEPCQKIVYKSKLSMLLENSKSDTHSSSFDKVTSKPNDDFFDSLENAQTSEMDESAQTVIEVPQNSSLVDSNHEGPNTYDSSIFGLKIEPEIEKREVNDDNDDTVSRKTTAEIEVPDYRVEARVGMTDDEIKEIQNVDLASFEKDSLEAMYYSLRKNELLIDQMHSLSNVEQISDQTEPPRQFTAKQKLMSMGESDSDDIVFKQLSMDYDEYSEVSNQHTARSTTDDDADVEVVRDVLYYNDGKQILPDHSKVNREPGDGASVASDHLFDNHSNADEQDVLTKVNVHHFEIFSLDEEIKNLESNVAPYQQDNPLFYAHQKIEKFLHQIHGNMNETEGDADDENDDEFLENPIDSHTSYLSENNFNEDEEEGDVLDELRNDFRESSSRNVLSSAVSEADSDYVDLGRTNPFKDDFNISTAIDNYLSTDSDSTYNSAATKIQAGARGFLTRRRIQSINRQSISERRSSIGNAAIDQSLDDMIEEHEERKKFKFHETESTFREDTITSSGEMEVYGITDIKVAEKKTASPVTDSGNESTTSIDTETQTHLRNKYEQFTNESSFDAIDEDKLNDVVDVIRTSNVQNKLRSPIKNKTLSNINFDEYDRVATRRMTLQRGIAVQGNSTPSDEENKSQPSDNSSGETSTNDENAKDGNGKKTSYDSPIRRKSTDSASVMTKSSNSLPDLQNSPRKHGFIQRQRTMPVQIETEIIRPLPKHMRKRIKSANSSAHSSQHATNSYKKKATY